MVKISQRRKEKKLGQSLTHIFDSLVKAQVYKSHKRKYKKLINIIPFDYKRSTTDGYITTTLPIKRDWERLCRTKKCQVISKLTDNVKTLEAIQAG